MEPSTFDEIAFFRALSTSGVRGLLIGRRALVLLGLPVLTADYDFWIAIDDIEALNVIAARFDLHPTHSPAEARGRGRYVLENDEHVDVLVARSLTTVDGRAVEFERLWQRRHAVRIDDVDVQLPSIEDLILTGVNPDNVAAIVNRRVSLEELREAVEGPIGEDERAEILRLVQWFTRRYPSSEERLAYVRQAYGRWSRRPRSG